MQAFGLVNMKAIVLYLISILGISSVIQPSEVNKLPAVFENDLISLTIPLSADTLLIYTDTGGKNFLYKSGINKLNTKRSRKKLWEKSNIENLFTEKEIPIPYLKEIYFINDQSSNFDGMLGREWFANKVWEFDYVNKTLKHHKFPEKNKKNINQTVRLYFKSDSLDKHIHHLPRIQIIVKSDTLSFLFDTGAQAHLSLEAQNKLNKNKLVGTSFINASTFEKWRSTYPEWSIIEDGNLSFDKKSDIIIVPEIQIGEKTVGPVEFVKRADSNFKVMSNIFMDKEIVGALGGNALSRLDNFIVNYKTEELIVKN